MADKKEITIVKGDTTGFGGRVLLTINCSSEVWDLTQLKAKWILHGIEHVFNDLTQPIEINYTKEQTEAFPLGDDYGILRFENQSGERVTADNTIPVKVINYVSGNAIATDAYTLDLEIKDGDEVVMNVLVEAAVTLELGPVDTLPAGSDATVVNTGTPNHLKLKFGIPQGAQGEEGPQGPEGPAGKDGKDGEDAKINGVNSLTLNASGGLSLSQNGSVATISGNTLQQAIGAINELIPEQASASNQLTDRNFVNSSISTNTANFIGTFDSVAELEAYSGPLTNNDYAFVVGNDEQGNTVYDRYKYTDATDPASWVFEYELNNSSFTADQWAAINSGATDLLIAQITTNGNAIGTLSSLNTSTKTDLVSAINEVNTTASGKVSDVTIVGNSIVAAGVAAIPIAATSGDYGLVKFGSTASGLQVVSGTGNLSIYAATSQNIIDKTNANRPIVPSNLDYAVKVGVTTNGNSLTDTEKTNALTWLGAEKIVALASGDSITLANNTTYSGGELSSFSITAPSSPAASFKSEINFSSGSTATVISSDFVVNWLDGSDSIIYSDGVAVFTPAVSTRYNVMIWYDGTQWNGVAKVV